MQVVEFINSRDRIAQPTPQARKLKLPQLVAGKGQKLYAIRNPKGKYWHYCYANADVAHAVMLKVYSSDEQNWVKSTDNATLSRICKLEHLIM